MQTQFVKYRRSRCCNLAATLVRTPKLARCDDLQLPFSGRIEVFGGLYEGTEGGDKRNQVECLARAQYIICNYPLPVDALAHLRGSEFHGGFDEENIKRHWLILKMSVSFKMIITVNRSV